MAYGSVGSLKEGLQLDILVIGTNKEDNFCEGFLVVEVVPEFFLEVLESHLKIILGLLHLNFIELLVVWSCY